MSVNQVKGKFIKISNDEALKASNAAGDGQVEILKVDSNDQIVLLDLPVVNDGVNPASNVSTESYVDSEISIVSDQISDHIADASDAHDASAISVVATGNLVATDAQAAFQELQGDIDTINTALGALSFDAESISYDNATSGLVAINVQDAIDELEQGIADLQQELDDTQSGAGLEADGSYVAPSAGGAEQTLLGSATSLKNADGILAERIWDVSTATGVFIDLITGEASYVPNASTNYLGSADDLVAADEALDSKIKEHKDQHDALVTATGVPVNPFTFLPEYPANGMATYIDDAVSLIDADNQLDSAIKGLEDNKVDRAGDAGLSGIHTWSSTDGVTTWNVSVDTENGLSSVQNDGVEVKSGAIGNDYLALDTINALGVPGDNYSIQMSQGQISLTSLGIASAPSSDEHVTTKKYVDDELALKLDLTGGEMSGNIDMNDVATIVNLPDPVNAQDAVNKRYVDAVAEGLHVHAPARLLADFDLDGSYDNGVDGVGAFLDFSLSPVAGIDGVSSFSVGDRIIVAFQNGSELDPENGLYYIADAADIDGNGDIIKLTRALDFNTPVEMAGGDFIFVQEGTQYADSGWVMTETVVTVGATPIKFLQFSGAGAYSAGDALSLTGTEFDVLYDNSTINLNLVNQLKLADTLVTIGSYGNASKSASFTVDQQGRLTSASEQDIEITASQVSDFSSAVQGEISVTDSNSIDLSYTAGQISADLRLDSANNALVIGIDGLKLDNTTVGAGSFGSASKSASFTVDAQGRLTSASDQDISITASQVSDFSTEARSLFSSGDGLDYDSANGIFSANLKANGGLKIDATELAIEPADFAGNGLEDDGSDSLQIKPEFSTIPDISVSSSCLSIANRWHKESYPVTAPVSIGSNDTFVLAFEPEPNSMCAFVDRLAIHEGEDYTISGSTVTFIGALATAGQQQLLSGDTIFFKYQKKAS